MGLFQGVFGKRATPPTAPPVDIEELLARLCLPASATNSAASRRVSIQRCNEISDILLNKGKDTGDDRLLAWSERPRIYIVLRNIQRLDLLDYFVKAELTDFHIPFNEDTLPIFLREDGLRESFLQFQQYVLSSGAKGLDNHGGPHLSFAGNAQRYFYYKESLGRGGYGEVDAVTSRLSLQSYARKRVLRGGDTTTNKIGQASLIRELSYLKSLSHIHLVRYVSSYTDEKYIAFLMQPVADCDLEKLLKNLGRSGRGVECLRPFFGCLTGAIQYLHENKIRHRDLKSRNILIKDGRVFVADFGTAYSWKGSKQSTTNHRNVPFTAEYMAPEIALHQSRSTASDMWSLGVVFLEMSTVLLGSTVRKMKSQLHAFSHPRGAEPYLWANLPVIDTWIEELNSCAAVRDESTEPLSWVRDLLQERPNKRPKAGDLMKQILESPSFHAFCCVDCWPVYEQRSFLYTQQPQDNDAFTPGNSADVHAQLTALLYPPVDKAREREKNQTIENWLDAVDDDDMNLTFESVNGTAESSGIEVPIQIVEDNSTYYSAESSDEERMVHFDGLSITGSYQSLGDTTESHSGQADGESERTIIPSEDDAESVDGLTVQGEAHKHEADIGAAYIHGFQSPNIWPLEEPEFNVWADDGRTDTITRGPEFLADMLPSSNTVWGYTESLDLPPPLPLTEGSISSPCYQEQREFVSTMFNPDEGSAVSLSPEQEMTTAPIEYKVLMAQSTKVAKPQPSTSTGTQGKSETASLTTGCEYDATLALSRETTPYEGESGCESTEGALNERVWTTDSDRSSLNQKGYANVEGVQENASQRAPKSEADLLQGPRSEKTQSDKPSDQAVWTKEGSEKAKSAAVEEVQKSLPPPKKKSPSSKEQVDESALIGKLQSGTTKSESQMEEKPERLSIQEEKPRAEEGKQDLQMGKPHSLENPQTNGASPETSSLEPSKLRVQEVEKVPPTNDPHNDLAKPKPRTETEPSNISSSNMKSGFKNTESQASSTEEQSAEARSKKRSMSLHKQALLSSVTQATMKKDPPTSAFSPEVYMTTTWEAASTQDTRIVPVNRSKLRWWKWLDRDQHILESLCAEGAVQAVRILLKDGCNPGTELKPRPAPLLLAIQGGTYQHYKCVQALINHGVNLNIVERKTGRTALQIAIEQPFFAGHTSLVRDLIQGGADTNKPDHTGKRPILSVFDIQKNDALEKHQLDALACLLVGGEGKETDVNVYTPHTHNSPLHLAIRRRSPMAVGLLLFRGVLVNAKNQAGATPLLLAAAQWAGHLVTDQKTILDLLLQEPNINLNEIAGVQRRTALHQAVFRASPTAVRMLLEKGADISIKDSEGKTAQQLALTLDSTKWNDEKAQIVQLLDKRKARHKTMYHHVRH
ncbi:hypothetical protein ABOM_006044 [Aspergillus bombycis]|uniref:Protein kinase domain-containing protein n=1 Tax=Aspergillus bombycis TaxID=109264 RepID=A0A1F8A2C0_9EURO|nr:hypothetical protein ABOM_006044 [Aspergillus bombycis]OGM45876.1 hypothetical protein ABOM_006044 [Aspergillus bombycis]